MNEVNKSHPVISDMDKNELDFRTKNDSLDKKLSGSVISDLVCIDSLNNIFRLSDLVAQKSILVYYYSELHCIPCYEMELAFLQDFFPYESYSNIVLASYFLYENFALFVKEHETKLPVYRIEHHKLNWEIENYGMPYYFIVHPDMTASHFYIPQQQFPKSNRQYLEKVKQFLSH
jgi:hypothetical protein